jgi:hypothetical protein
VKKLSVIEKRVLRTMGSRGGKEAAASLTPAQRKERAQKAAQARWGKRKTTNYLPTGTVFRNGTETTGNY